MDRKYSLSLLGIPPDYVPAREILRHFFSRVLRGHPGITSLVINFKYGGGCHDTALGGASRGVGGRTRRFCMGRPVACGFLKHG